MIKKIFITLLIITMGEVVFSQNDNIKAIFIYNFTKYIQWPTKITPFKIGIIGNKNVYDNLKKIAENNINRDEEIIVSRLSDLKNISNNNIIFVGNSKLDVLNNILELTDTSKTLVITDNDKSSKNGAGINFVIKNNKQRFKLEKDIIEKHSLTINPILENIAVKDKAEIYVKKDNYRCYKYLEFPNFITRPCLSNKHGFTIKYLRPCQFSFTHK